MELSDLLAKMGTDVVADDTVQIAADTELLMSGIVDSLGVINLVTWIEDHESIEIDPGDVVIENFETPNAILAFIDSIKALSA